MSCNPQIVGDFDYREQPGKWRFVLESELWIKCPKDWFGTHEFADAKGRVWSKTIGNYWIISEGYAWDGCSPKFYLLGRHWGTPDFEATRAPSCLHDSMGQFRHLACIKDQLTGKVWNERFKEFISEQGAPKNAMIYHAGLVAFNPLHNGLGKLFGAKPTGQCLIHQ